MWKPYQITQEEQNRRLEYWPEGGDFFFEMETRNATCDYPTQIRLESGRKLVFMIKYTRSIRPGPHEKSIVAAGYKARNPGILNILRGKVIEIIPKEEINDITKELSVRLRFKPSEIEFWD